MAAPTSGVATGGAGTPATAAPMNAATIVVGGVRSTERPTIAGWMRLFSVVMSTTNATRAMRAGVRPGSMRATRRTAAEEAPDLRDEVRDHRPDRGDRGQRNAQDQAEGKDLHALEDRDEHRSTEVATNGAVGTARHGRPAAGGRRGSACGTRPTRSSPSIEDGDGERLTMGIAAMPLTRVLAISAMRSSVICDGKRRNQSWTFWPRSLSRAQPPIRGGASISSRVPGSCSEKFLASATARGPRTATSRPARAGDQSRGSQRRCRRPR